MKAQQRRWLGLTQFFHLNPRSASEAVIVLAAFALGQPSLRSLVVGLTIALVGEFWRLWANGYPANTLSSGPFRLVRHPHILGSVLLYFGLALASANAYVAVLTMLLLPWAYRGRYRRAELRARSELGPWYAAYQAQVPALLPRLIPAPAGLSHGQRQISSGPKSVVFSLGRSLLRGRHRELDMVVAMGITALVLLVVARAPAGVVLQRWIVVALLGLGVARTIYYRWR